MVKHCGLEQLLWELQSFKQSALPIAEHQRQPGAPSQADMNDKRRPPSSPAVADKLKKHEYGPTAAKKKNLDILHVEPATQFTVNSAKLADARGSGLAPLRKHAPGCQQDSPKHKRQYTQQLFHSAACPSVQGTYPARHLPKPLCGSGIERQRSEPLVWRRIYDETILHE